MSKIAKLVVLAGAAAALSGCFLRSQPEEIVIVEPAPVVVEPVQTKY
ncbi:hypothetical protein JQC91_13370 [Jannaschia sp. Os4]|nr:hypothetical protein [Jannaschia sp. Os4]MBM2577293.1 hypothetical protein [Jannaschia sp. Os4]